MGLVDERKILGWIYENATGPEDLPWHRDEPWPLLRKLVEKRDLAGRALDLGCGTGEFAVYLAEKGYEVTGIDLFEIPLRKARDLADEAGVDLRLEKADVLRWSAEKPFDLVIDSGCYHGFDDEERAIYREHLLDRLAPEGDFFLTHFGKKHPFDWRPIGPYRRPRGRIREEFAPEFTEVAYEDQIQEDVPFPVGPRPLLGQYWFRRADNS